MIIFVLGLHVAYAQGAKPEGSSGDGDCINASGGKVSDELKGLCLTKEDLEKK